MRMLVGHIAQFGFGMRDIHQESHALEHAFGGFSATEVYTADILDVLLSYGFIKADMYVHPALRACRCQFTNIQVVLTLILH